VLSAAAGLLILWAVAVALLWRAGRGRAGLHEALRLAPDLARLLRRLADDPAVPRGVRVRLALTLAYLAMPIDLVPDVLPVIGWADDAIVVALALRAVIRRAGPAPIARHWPGTPDGLRTARRLAGLEPA
jgi:uncharacterized membrane protein YkvA (DUF1232 family)